MQKSEEYLKDFWDIIKEANVYFEGVLEGKHIHKESLLEEIKAEKFPNLKKEMDIQTVEDQWPPTSKNRDTSITVKLLKS